MIQVIERINQKIFDGSEQDCSKQIFNVYGKEIRLSNFYNTPFRQLKKEIGAADFDYIIQRENLKLEASICDIYKTSDDLEVYFFLYKHYIYIFSFGEYQPSRFILKIESLWKIIL